MGTIDIVIRIPKDIYKKLDNPFDEMWKHYLVYCSYAIRNGTVLPKGHDALLDAGQLMDYCHNQIEGHKYVDCNVIARFPCVIKADRGDDNG